jgi:hypothetical protein
MHFSLQIFAFLDPLDVLRLSRTTKRLRVILTPPTARQIWIAVLANVPDCPPVPREMTELAWVHLVFKHVCHVSHFFAHIII